jgi:hypothetical protein
VRTSLEAGEALRLKVLVLSANPPGSVSIAWREMGRGSWRTAALEHVARGVFSVILPAPSTDLEYYVEAVADGRTVRYPATAPERSQTVVVLPVVK